MTDPTISQDAREAAWQDAVAKTNRLQRELDITNADHIALWLEHNTIPDEPMNQCASWLACRIVEAHEAHLRTPAPMLMTQEWLDKKVDADPVAEVEACTPAGEAGEMVADSGMSGEAVERAEWAWANLPVGPRKWTSLATHEKALVCHTITRLSTTDTEAMRLSKDLPLHVKMAGAEAITAEHMAAKANYDAACDCWDAMIDALAKGGA